MSGHQYRTLPSAVCRLRPSAASIAAAAAVQDPGLLLQLHATLRQSLIDKPLGGSTCWRETRRHSRSH
jgi:hypothetical protein